MGDSLTGTYDLTQSDNDQYLNNDDYFAGMTHWKITIATDNIMEADKFLPNSKSSND